MRACFSASVFLTVALASSVTAQDKPSIVADNYPLAWMTEQLTGSSAEVRQAAPNGVDPSFWRPSPTDLGGIQQADLIVLNGAEFSKWPARSSLPRSKVVDTSAGFAAQLIATEEVTHSHGADGEHSHTGTASYTWLDFNLAALQAEEISEALSRQLAKDAAQLAENSAALAKKLMELDTLASEKLQGNEAVGIIATHPRYQYLARAYGLNIASLEWEAGAMPSAEQWSELSELAQTSGASILIWEADPPPEAVERVEQLGLQSVTFNPLAKPPRSGDFVSVMAEQINSLASTINLAR